MKKITYSIILCLMFSIFTTALSAQSKAPKLPMENKPSVEKFLKEIYDAWEKKDYKAMKNYYDSRAGEISPDGSMVQGIKMLDASWKAFDAMMDSKPTFTYQLTSSRMINNEIAIITWNSEADIKVKGQQVGGKATAMAVLKKKNDTWTIEFDSLTPVMEMPMPSGMSDKKQSPPADSSTKK